MKGSKSKPMKSKPGNAKPYGGMNKECSGKKR